MYGRFMPRPLALAAALAVAAPPVAAAGIPGGVAIVLGFHIVPASDRGSFPWPPSPDDLAPHAAEPGFYDVWLFLHTRSPLVGAWSMAAALDYDGAGGRGLDVLEWEGFVDQFHPCEGWPAAGTGFRGVWRRERCQDPERYMRRGRDGWWVQPVLRLGVRVHGPDRILFSDPEPGVRPQLTECADEMHELDGSESWSAVIPAFFGIDPEETWAPRPATGARKATWGSLKVAGSAPAGSRVAGTRP